MNGQLVRSLHRELFVTHSVRARCVQASKSVWMQKRNIVSFPETERQLSNHLDNEKCLSRYVIEYNTFLASSYMNVFNSTFNSNV